MHISTFGYGKSEIREKAMEMAYLDRHFFKMTHFGPAHFELARFGPAYFCSRRMTDMAGKAIIKPLEKQKA